MNKKNLLTKGVIMSFIVFTLITLNLNAQNNQAKENNLIDLVINVDVCTTTADTVRITGPFWNWNPNGGPLGTNNGNGSWSFTLSPAPSADMEYLVIVDGVQENLIADMQNGGTCAPVTDYANYANRKWVVGSGDINIIYDRCVPCSNLVINVDVCTTTADTVRITGPFWGWNPNGGPLGTNNGNGTWSFTLSPAPTADMEYLVIVDGVQENLISDMQNGGTCAPVTDYFSYANRKWVVGSGDVFISYDRCVPCSYPNIVITTCAPGATSVKLTGPNWQWNPNFGPSAVNNGNGTWTFSISPAPNDTLEYKLIKDGVFEDLIPAMVSGGTCAPVTDYANYANRRWLIADGAISNTFGSCAACSVTGINENINGSLQIFPNPTNSNVKIRYSNKSFKTKLLNILGEVIIESSSDNFEDELNLSNFATGIYNLTITSNNETKSIKLIKE